MAPIINCAQQVGHWCLPFQSTECSREGERYQFGTGVCERYHCGIGVYPLEDPFSPAHVPVNVNMLALVFTLRGKNTLTRRAGEMDIVKTLAGRVPHPMPCSRWFCQWNQKSMSFGRGSFRFQLTRAGPGASSHPLPQLPPRPLLASRCWRCWRCRRGGRYERGTSRCEPQKVAQRLRGGKDSKADPNSEAL